MNSEILSVVISSLAGTAAFWLAYRIIMYNRPLHRFARIFLLLAMLLPIAVPPLQLLLSETTVAYTVGYTLPEQIVGRAAAPAPTAIPWAGLLVVLYATISLLMLGRQAYGYFQLKRRLGSATMIVRGGIGVYTRTGSGPGTLGRSIFFPGSDITHEILAHETGHVRMGHRYDLALANVLCALFWINPFLRALRRELRLVHEFEADAFAARQGANPEPYARLLLSQGFGLQTPAFSHAFFHHPIKQRILMLFAKETNRSRSIARVITAGCATLTISASLLFVQCQPEPTEAPAPQKPATSVQQSSGVYKHSDEMPAFNGDLSNHLASSLKYPEAARKAGAEGRVIVQFVVTDAGNVTDATVVRSSGSDLLDAEALRVVNAMPAWKPGKDKGKAVSVYFTLPITFQLDDESPAKKLSFTGGVPNEKGNFECIGEDQLAIANRMQGEFQYVDDHGKVVGVALSMDVQ